MVEIVGDQKRRQAPLLRRPLRPEMLAWGVLVASCLVSLLFCLSVSFFAYNFFFRSTIPVSANLQVARGTVGIISPGSSEEVAERSARPINNLTTIRTDEQSLGTLSFKDESGMLYAQITLRPETQLTLLRSSRPRFSMAGNDHIIEIDGLVGRLDVLLITQIDINTRVFIHGKREEIAYLNQPGRYEIHVDEDSMQLLNHNAVLSQLRRGEQRRFVPRGYLGDIRADEVEAIALQAAYTNLVDDHDFRDFLATDEISSLWQCSNQNDIASDLLGNYRDANIAGLDTLRFVRLGEITGHGETRCIHQFFAEDGTYGIDARQYEHLAIQATIRIQHQSLSRCGFRGSECPIMLRMDYIDGNGSLQRWFQGFYIPQARDSELDNPLRCSNCLALHERVSAQTWYHYDSDNLIPVLFPPGLQPRRLLSLQVYASGHNYDAHLVELSLQARDWPSEDENTATEETPADG